MKKYRPSISNNNAIRDELIKEMKTILFKIDRGQYSKVLDADTVKDVNESIKNSFAKLESVLFAGNENIFSIKESMSRAIDNMKKMLKQDYNNRLSESAKRMAYYVDTLSAIAFGTIEDIETETKSKTSWARKKLDKRLDDLDAIRNAFDSEERRLEREIVICEKDLSELDARMVLEENERIIDEIYRRISATKSKLSMYDVRRSNYSACFDILDIIHANASEILIESLFSKEDIGRAKALLDIKSLKNVINDPARALAILTIMEREIKAISKQVQTIDDRVLDLNTEQTTVTDSALAYKENLIRIKRQKENQADDLESLKPGVKEPDKTKLTNKEEK